MKDKDICNVADASSCEKKKDKIWWDVPHCAVLYILYELLVSFRGEDYQVLYKLLQIQQSICKVKKAISGHCLSQISGNAIGNYSWTKWHAPVLWGTYMKTKAKIFKLELEVELICCWNESSVKFFFPQNKPDTRDSKAKPTLQDTSFLSERDVWLMFLLRKSKTKLVSKEINKVFCISKEEVMSSWFKFDTSEWLKLFHGLDKISMSGTRISQ